MAVAISLAILYLKQAQFWLEHIVKLIGMEQEALAFTSTPA
jgi:hypothetical protein